MMNQARKWLGFHALVRLKTATPQCGGGCVTRLKHPALTTTVCVVLGLVWASSASASSPITAFSITPSTTQAGGHPNVTIDEENLTRRTQILPQPNCACQDPKSITFELPPGLIGNPHATPQCDQADFGDEDCPEDSQVGIGTALFSGLAIYNLVPPPGEAGLLGFDEPLLNIPIYVVLSSRTNSDYGLVSKVTNITHLLPVEGTHLELWGVPADPSHTPQRQGPRGCHTECNGGFPSNAELLPFLDNPTSCGMPLSASAETLSFDGGTSRAEGPYPATTGCDQLSFNPSLFVQPTTQQTDSASGSDVDLKVPQETSPSVPSGSEIRALSVTLPPGFTLTPNASDGKAACTEAETNLNSLEAAECPEFSKVGTLSIHTSVLPGALPGYVYIREPKPGDPYRIILVAHGFGVNAKILGDVLTDPQTGQVTLSFPSLPEFPFEEFDLHFFGSERGLLATPTQCGEYPVNASFTPWDASLPEQHSTQYFVLSSGPNGQSCPSAQRSFTPRFEAGVADATAGAHSPFTLNVTRKDGDQELSSLDVSTPPGFTATLAGVRYCSDAEIAAASEPSYSGLEQEANPSCPAASQIGTSDTGTGAGSHPVYFPGKVYLAGPYKGAPLSLVVISPALSGPYDFGSVVVRAALKIDPTTAQVTTVSDPLPQIVAGIPLRLRSLMISLDRSGFALNPTNCNPLSLGAKVFGDQGAESDLSAHFQATDCTNLGFSPKLALKLSGATKRNANPALKAVLTQGSGEANISRAAVTLPHSELIDNAHIKDPCTRVQFAENKCPVGSVIGFARAETPLLAKPLEGPVYLRSNPENKSGLPDLVAALNGQIDINLDGRIDTVHESIRTTFQTVPDAPVSNFTLNLYGGSKGLLVNSENLCKGPKVVVAKIAGQNGLTVNRNPVLQTPCGKAAKPKRHLRLARVVG
jgi:hypothetical protein